MIGHAPTESPQETTEDPSPDRIPAPPAQPLPRETGGRPGPEPTRYGDWEKDGRCIDF
jgi:hypothetical protein